MGSRPLRQYYERDRTLTVEPALGPSLATWRRHRRRFLEAVGGLTEDQWKATTRCTAWNAKDVLCHLITTDTFWVISLGVVPGGTEPTRHLVGFDPSAVPDALVQTMRDRSYDTVLEQFAAGGENLDRALAAIGPDQWDRPAESPMGHVDARFVFAHALWDSWTHERDILVPLGLAPPPEPDELLAVTWFVLLLGGLQGGLLDDDAAVGPGPDRPVTATLAFDDLPEHPLEIAYDHGVRIARAVPDAPAVKAGSALALTEGFTGRAPVEADGVPPDLVAQLQRASTVL